MAPDKEITHVVQFELFLCPFGILWEDDMFHFLPRSLGARYSTVPVEMSSYGS
jgi:hypothetical protein